MFSAYDSNGDGTDDSFFGDFTNAGKATVQGLELEMQWLATERANYGAAQNRFDSIISVLQVSSENQSATRGRIMDADFAAETANLSRANILQQAGNAMVAQANQLPQQVLALLR